MADYFTDTYGLMEFSKLTGLIKALFGQLIGKECKVNSHAYVVIDYSCQGSERFWAEVAEDLVNLARELALPIVLQDDDKDDWLGAALEALVEKYGCSDPDRLNNLIENVAMSDSASLIKLFEIAMLINDGHNIKHMTYESAYTCNVRKTGAFGGYGVFCGQHFSSSFGSNDVYQLGQNVENMLMSGETLLASRVFKAQIEGMLAGIHDEKMREEVRAHLLLKDPQTETD